MEEIKFRFPSNPYDKDWAIECLTGKHRDKIELVRKGDNVFKALGYDGFCVTLPYDCLLLSGEPINGYDPHGRMFSWNDSEVYLYYFE